MSSVVDAILGRSLRPGALDEDDVPPVMAKRPQSARRLPPEDEESEKQKRKVALARSSVVAGILGMTESGEEGIIPKDAKPFDVFSTQSIPGLKEAPNFDNSTPSEPASIANGHGEELIPPTAALVAPDVTPNVLQLIDPSQVPAPPTPVPPPAPVDRPLPPTGAPGAQQPQPALDILLGRQNPAPQAPQAAPPVTAESFVQTLHPGEMKSKIAESMIPAMEGGSEMPKHIEGDGKAVYNAFRQFSR